MKDDYRKRIVIDPNVHFGKPCLKDTRIPVENVLELVQEGIHFEDIKACAKYATESV